jgi:hypothetical protein
MTAILRHGEAQTFRQVQFDTNCALFLQQSADALFAPFFGPSRTTRAGHYGTIFGTVNYMRMRGVL